MIKQGLLNHALLPAIEQTNFEPDYRSVREMLETRIAQFDAVIHIVAVRYGAKARIPPPCQRARLGDPTPRWRRRLRGRWARNSTSFCAP